MNRVFLFTALISWAATVPAQMPQGMPSQKEMEEMMQQMQKEMAKLTPAQRKMLDENFSQMTTQPEAPSAASSSPTPSPQPSAPAQTTSPQRQVSQVVSLQVTDSAPESVRTYFDEYEFDVDRALPAFLAANRGLVGGKARTVTTTQALAAARALLGRDPETVLRRVRALPNTKTPAALGIMETELLAQRRTVEALAVSLVAYAMAPDSPSTQFNVATLLYTLGKPNEALALYDDLLRRKAAPASGWWKTPANALDYARALAMLASGRAQQARPLLERVVAAEPNLSEAALALSLLDAEEQRKPRRNFVMGLFRTRANPMVCGGTGTNGKDAATADPYQEGSSVALPFEKILDFSRGSDGLLPSVPLATSAWIAPSVQEKLFARDRREEAEMRALDRRKSELWRKVRHSVPGTYATETREDRLFQTLAQPLYHSQKILELDQEFDRAMAAELESWQKNWEARDAELHRIEMQIAVDAGSMKPPPPNSYIERRFCALGKPVASEYLQRTLPATRAYDHAVRERFRVWHRYASTLAGEIADPQWHEVFRLEIERERHRHMLLLLHNAEKAARLAATGVRCDELKDEPEPGATQPTDLPKCSDEQARYSAGADVGETPGGAALVGVEANCRGISGELNLPLLPEILSISGEIGIDMNGEVTIFVGPKAQTVESLGTYGSVKSGGYIKVGSDGVHDIGAKGEIKAGQRVTPNTTATYKVDEMEFTIMPSPNSPPPPAPGPRWLGTIPNL